MYVPPIHSHSPILVANHNAARMSNATSTLPARLLETRVEDGVADAERVVGAEGAELWGRAYIQSVR